MGESNIPTGELRLQLAQLRVELESLKARFDEEQTLARTLISHLISLCSGLDPDLDDRLKELKQGIAQPQGLSALTQRLESFERFLYKLAKSGQFSLKSSDQALISSRQQLENLTQLPANLQQKVTELFAKQPPGSSREYRQRSVEIIELYQQLLNHVLPQIQADASQQHDQLNQAWQKLKKEYAALESDRDALYQQLEQEQQLSLTLLDQLLPLFQGQDPTLDQLITSLSSELEKNKGLTELASDLIHLPKLLNKIQAQNDDGLNCAQQSLSLAKQQLKSLQGIPNVLQPKLQQLNNNASDELIGDIHQQSATCINFYHDLVQHLSVANDKTALEQATQQLQDLQKIKQQQQEELTQLKQQLKHESQQNQQHHGQQDMAQATLAQSISMLLEQCQGLDETLDSSLSQLSTELKSPVDPEQIQKKLQLLHKQLQKQRALNKQDLNTLGQALKAALKPLRQLKGLPNALQHNLQQLQTKAPAVQLAAIQQQSSTLLTLYPELLDYFSSTNESEQLNQQLDERDQRLQTLGKEKLKLQQQIKQLQQEHHQHSSQQKEELNQLQQTLQNSIESLSQLPKLPSELQRELQQLQAKSKPEQLGQCQQQLGSLLSLLPKLLQALDRRTDLDALQKNTDDLKQQQSDLTRQMDQQNIDITKEREHACHLLIPLLETIRAQSHQLDEQIAPLIPQIKPERGLIALENELTSIVTSLQQQWETTQQQIKEQAQRIQDYAKQFADDKDLPPALQTQLKNLQGKAIAKNMQELQQQSLELLALYAHQSQQMGDTKSLQTLQQKLDTHQKQQQRLNSQLIQEQTLSQGLINQLMLLCRGLDRELDNKLSDFKKSLSKERSLQPLSEQLHELDKLFDKQIHANEQLFRNAEKMFLQSKQQLEELHPLPEPLLQEVSEQLTKRSPYSLREYQQQFGERLSLYQQLLNHFKQGHSESLEAPVIDTESTHIVATLDDNEILPPLREQISKHLQQLVGDIELAEGLSGELKAIRSELLTLQSPEKLGEFSLKAIQVILKGLCNERTTFHQFLHALATNISQLQKNFEKSVDETLSLQRQEEEAEQSLHHHFSSLQKQTRSAQSLDQLKQGMISGIDTISSLLIQRRHLKAREQVLLGRLGKMGDKLHQVQEEAVHYKKQLDLQRDLLHIDKLTQLNNREALEERLAMEFKRCKRYNTPLGVAMADLDLFKRINDQFGHIAGDKVLKVIARSMQISLRDTDFIARFGGEEFVILLPNIPLEQLATPLNKLRETVSEIPFHFKDQDVSVTISIGATLLQKNDTTTRIFERADAALYEAKKAGRNMVIVRKD